MKLDMQIAILDLLKLYLSGRLPISMAKNEISKIELKALTSCYCCPYLTLWDGVQLKEKNPSNNNQALIMSWGIELY